MYCKNCGKEIDDNANVCTYCGTPQGQGGMVQSSNNDSGSFGWSVFRMLYSDRRLDFIPCLEQRKTEYCEKSRNRSDCWCGSRYYLFYVIIFVIGIGSASMGYYY